MRNVRQENEAAKAALGASFANIMNAGARYSLGHTAWQTTLRAAMRAAVDACEACALEINSYENCTGQTARRRTRQAHDHSTHVVTYSSGFATAYDPARTRLDDALSSLDTLQSAAGFSAADGTAYTDARAVIDAQIIIIDAVKTALTA